MYAVLLDCAWAQPSIDPFNELYRVDRPVLAQIGVMGPQGFQRDYPDAMVYPLFGCCKGCFYRDETVEVFGWPFSDIAPGEPKYVIRGLGEIKAWTDKQGTVHQIRRGGRNPTGAGNIPRHFISENGQGGGQQLGPTFPGMPYPHAIIEGSLADKPTFWKWCDAEALWTPLVQAPDDRQPE